MASGSSYTLNIKALFDASNVKAGVSEIQNSLKSLKLPDKLATDLNTSFVNVNKALDDFTSKVEKGIKTKGDANGITRSFETVTKELTKLDNLMIKVKSQFGEGADLNSLIRIDDKTRNELNQIETKIKAIKSELSNTNASKLNQLQQALDKIKSSSGAHKQGQAAFELFKEGDVEKAIDGLTKIIDKLNQYKEKYKDSGKDLTGVGNSIEQLKQMRSLMLAAQSESASKIQEINNLSTEAATKLAASQSQVTNEFNKSAVALHNYQQGAVQAGQGVADLTARQQQFVSEVDQVKSRIQYFFGLANSINLVKRAVRGAVDTIKELDKAMTETAVVTDYTVKDMWSQLPEYTKRANQLGVTTKEAYESATLYFQQGLNADQAAALSTETLKMARIAGLDAAEATDRMTNALRGFNMALDEQSAQRVDDVYSQLAAHTASNVDEISTAMTKVASLAHNANMEFETTAAFLAQIIETTRESAETAGTALKTVVARFSEVKKLVDEGTLKGTDEEGQAIDVNKVGAALRTAGIDLNKYFLGEVGLDDIFIELASKWDSLTAIQQRYIATQAAGSRQQSRFIALMQDYARTQELVGMAYDAEGASEKQFEKTQDSLQSKLARLKNAWNEFLMGITNSGVVKGVVDALTLVLNIINKITGALGDGAGSVLKFGTAMAALGGARSFFAGGGLGARAIGGLISNGLIGNKIRASLGLGEFVTDESGNQSYQRYSRDQIKGNQNTFFGAGGTLSSWGKNLQEFKNAKASRFYTGGQSREAKNLFDALGNRFINAKDGKGIGAKLSGLLGGASGATTLAVAIGGITVAATAAAAAIKAIYDASPAGQLKNAQKLADAMSDVAKSTQHQAENYKQAKEQIKEYNAAVDQATTVSDRNKAVQNRNEYIESLLKENADYAEYLTTTFKDGEIVLTLDEDALATAANKAAEAAVKAAAGTTFAQATVAGRQANVYEAQMRGVDLNNRTLMGYNDYGELVQREMTKQEYAKYSQLASDIVAENTKMQQYAKNAYAQLIDADKLGDDLADELASAMAQSFDETNLETANWSFLRSRGYWANQYQSLYGTEADVNMQTADIARAVKQAEQTQKQSDNVSKLEDLLTGENSALYQSLLDAYTGAASMDNIKATTANEIFAEMGFNTKLPTFTNDLIAITDALGISISEFKQTVEKQADQNKKVAKQNKSNIYQQALKNGLNIDAEFAKQVQGLSPKMASIISNVVSQATELLSSEGMKDLIPELISMDEESLGKFQNFFTNFNLDDPINAFKQLKQAQEDALTLPDDNFGNAYRLILSDIVKTNKAIFDTGNLVQTFLTSASYDGLTDSIEGFLKENKKLTAANIEELAESCSELQVLLKDTTVTAQGLAAAFTAFEGANLPIDALTSSLLAALSAGEDFDTLLDKVSQWIKDFNEGTDMKEGTEHISEVLEKATDYIYNWEFGNQPLENIYDHIFGEGKYSEYMDKYWGNLGIDEIEQKLQGDIDRVKSYAEHEGRGALDALLGMGAKGFGKQGDVYTWDLSQYDSASQAIQDVANHLGIAEDAARAFIEAWGSHMYNLRTEWDNLNFKDQIKAFSDSLGENAIITQQELDALAQKAGKDANEVLKAINDVRSAANEPIVVVVDWQNKDGQALSGEELINKFNEQIGALKEIPLEFKGLSPFPSTTIGTKTVVDYSNFLNEGNFLNGDNIDFSSLTDHLVNSLKLSDSQAKEIANNIANQTGKNLSQEIEIPVKAEDGSIDIITETVSESTAEGLQKAIEAKNLEAEYQLLANTLVDSFSSGLADTAESTSQALGNAATSGANLASSAESAAGSLSEAASSAESIQGALDQASSSMQSFENSVGEAFGQAADGAKNLDQAVEDVPKDLDITATYTEVNRPAEIPDQTVTINYVETNRPGKLATGGLVGSYAKGSENFHVKPGTALTGEEGPEIIWNKNEGYAYVTGSDGPEFQDLKPGDRVFNASETKKILRNSMAQGGKVDSFATGGWKDGGSNSSNGGGKGKDKTSAEWKNELDWLYNLMEDIVELERDQKELEEEYEDILTDQTKNSKDLYNLLIQRLGNLNVQLNRQTFALTKREQEMREFMDTTNDQDKYLWYNWSDRTIEIDWDAIDKIVDGDVYKHVKDLISEAEEIQGKMDDAEDAIQDIENQIQELENIWRDTYVDFEKRVLDALVQSYQDVIDNYSELNDTLNNTNDEILSAIQKEIDLERQIRDNTETEEDISDKEARLAYLQRDTTGANAQEILSLQKELDENRQDYEDSLVDQAIERLQESNDEAAKQRERQIEIMQAQLDYQKENGEFNERVYELMSSALSPDGTLLTDSDLYLLLSKQENWAALSDVNKSIWEEELNSTFKEVGAFLLKQYADWNGEFYTQVAESINAMNKKYKINVGSYSQAKAGGSSDSGSGGGGGGGNTSKGSGGGGKKGNGKTSSGVVASIAAGLVAGVNAAVTNKITAAVTAGAAAGVAAGVAKATSSTVKKPVTSGSGGCFAPGTKILMGDNKIKNIEDVQINDIIMAYDETTNNFVPKRVTESYPHYNTPRMVKITFDNNTNIELTPGHPLYSTKGWKSLDIENSLLEHTTIASLLKIGDIIININGSAIVTNIEYLNIGYNYTSYNLEVEDCHTFLANGFVAHNASRLSKRTYAYATGGLNTRTGPAWLDGTPSEPEYVLNARQTQAFLKLADVLPAAMNGSAPINNSYGGDIYLNLDMHVDEIANDYDVDRIANRVKDILYDASSYRNVNTLNFIR